MTTGVRTPSPEAPAPPVAQARFFRVLADPTRLAILAHLLARPHSVSELIESTGLPQSRISNHLACLRWCEFVRADRQGRKVIYTIADARLQRVLDLAGEMVADNAEHLATCARIGPHWM
jgi:ArsR family transcriptional regulator, cadmium/lead-responsive transcriptional repressor